MREFYSLLVLLLALAAAPAARAASSDWVATPESSVRLVTAVSAPGTLAAIPAGIEIELQPGWKTYWRSPGDAGYPVSVDWQGSENLAAAGMRWPAPHRFSLFGLDTFGYSDRVMFPLTLVPERAGEAVRLAARVRYLVCEEICIPYEADLALDLPAGPAGVAPEAQLIAQFEAQVPGLGAEHGIEIASVRISDGAQPVLSVLARSDFPFIAPDLLVEGTNDWRFPAPEIERRDENREILLSIVAEPLAADAPPLDSLPLVLTLVDGTRGAEFTADVANKGVGTPAAGGGLGAMLLIALLGGLILNLMPCVLPVLSLKLLAVIGHGGGERAAVRRSFLATAAGIVVAFLVLALALAALRASGAAIGWGIQFQQPLFLLAMAAVVTLFAANLAGWFEIPLPQWIGNRFVTERPEGRNGLAGAFGTGLLATLLATPCSAPFVGTAVGFALARGTGEIVTIFAAMGIGLALPYLLVALKPRLATALPRPGPWMVWLRRLLALALIGTAIWLLSVAAANLGIAAAAISAALLAAMLLLLWLNPRLAPGLQRALPVAILLLIVGALAPVLWRDEGAGPPAGAAIAEAFWRPFDQPAIATLVGEGRTVFVDVTADWCITCEVNKRLVLRRDPVAARLSDPALVAMQADWTRPDDGIAAYLASFGRYGIPFNVVYGPAAPDGIVLPELLDRDSVLEALERARGG
jgi:suppressor for copper-sensitivity B